MGIRTTICGRFGRFWGCSGGSESVRVAFRRPAVFTPDDDVAACSRPNAGVDARPEIGVALVAGESAELRGKAASVTLCDTASETHVLAREVGVALGGRLAGELVESLDALFRDGHDRWGEGARQRRSELRE